MTNAKRVSFLALMVIGALLCGLSISRHSGRHLMGAQQRQLVGEFCSRASENVNRTRPVHVAIFDAQLPGLRDRTAGVAAGLNAENCTWESIGPIEIAEGALGRFDVVVFAGGNARHQAALLREDGRRAVLSFVSEGRGYVGICAGAHLASCQYEWGLGLIDAALAPAEIHAKMYGPQPSVGAGAADMQLTDGGRRVFLRVLDDVMTIECAGGPIFMHGACRDDPRFLPLATFLTATYDCQVNNHNMVGAPAIVAARYGKGYVIVFSPHPESLDQTKSLLVDAIYATARVAP